MAIDPEVRKKLDAFKERMGGQSKRRQAMPKAVELSVLNAQAKTNRITNGVGVCPSCKHTVYMALKVWHRRTRPRCSRCGDYIAPSDINQAELAPMRISAAVKSKAECVLCKTKLHGGRTDPFCSCASCRRVENALIIQLRGHVADAEIDEYKKIDEYQFYIKGKIRKEGTQVWEKLDDILEYTCVRHT